MNVSRTFLIQRKGDNVKNKRARSKDSKISTQERVCLSWHYKYYSYPTFLFSFRGNAFETELLSVNYEHLCTDDSWNTVWVNFYFQSSKRKPATQNMLSKRQHQLRMSTETLIPPFNGSCRDIKPSICISPSGALSSLPLVQLTKELMESASFQLHGIFFPLQL